MGGHSRPQIRLEYASAEALRADYDSNLRKGRAFALGATGVSERDLCALVLIHPDSGETLSLAAEAVWVKRDEPGIGVGVQLQDFDDDARARLAAFVERSRDADQLQGDGGASEDRRPRNVHERVRRLSSRERDMVARQGTLPERVALERCYGASVWEGLLHNPNLTPPEVARIAKFGNLPKPLVAIIVSNGTWVAIPEIQRALLSNPRVAGQHLERVLRTMSQADLARVAQQTNYRVQVRQAARRLMRK